MTSLKEFVQGIVDFPKLSLSDQVDCLGYYLLFHESRESISPTEIRQLFSELKIPPYSNLPRYLLLNIKKSRLKPAKYFMFSRGRYYLTPARIESIELGILNKIREEIPSDKLYPQELFRNTRSYVFEIAKEASICYDKALYNASSVMIRRLLETLIIEAFERKGLVSKLKDANNNFYYLSDLIRISIGEPALGLSRNVKVGLPILKNLGDLSAHSRRYLAKKSDIDNKIDDIRVVIGELLNIIDYPNWH